MREIRDEENHLACMYDVITGTVHYKNRDGIVIVKLAPGSVITIERRGTQTILQKNTASTLTVNGKIIVS